jgi:hypothetical protein
MNEMLEENSYWDIDILIEYRKKKKKEINQLEKNLWSRIWNWRKIKKLKADLDKIGYV